jgi:hypothetical protein
MIVEHRQEALADEPFRPCPSIYLKDHLGRAEDVGIERFENNPVACAPQFEKGRRQCAPESFGQSDNVSPGCGRDYGDVVPRQQSLDGIAHWLISLCVTSSKVGSRPDFG